MSEIEQKWKAAVQAKLEAGMDRAAAVRQVAKEQPELRARLVEEANAGRSKDRLLGSPKK